MRIEPHRTCGGVQQARAAIKLIRQILPADAQLYPAVHFTVNPTPKVSLSDILPQLLV
jgi:hypothetical protein